MANEIIEIGDEARMKVDDFKDEQFIDRYLKVYKANNKFLS